MTGTAGRCPQYPMIPHIGSPWRLELGSVRPVDRPADERRGRWRDAWRTVVS